MGYQEKREFQINNDISVYICPKYDWEPRHGDENYPFFIKHSNVTAYPVFYLVILVIAEMATTLKSNLPMKH